MIMFHLNKNLEIKIEMVCDKPLFIIDNFYKDPNKICDYLFNRDVPLWKMDEKPSYNNV